ncbi:MAG: tetratricopeptide repeat protein [Kiritimatiellae bacterium]|nr:tetratricopeptide repeat protein [Kiritimatiellia bacterium]
MTDEHRPPAKSGPPGAAAPAESAPLDWQSLLRDYGRPLLLGAAIAIVIVVAVGFVRQRRRAAEEEAARLLTSGRVEQIEKLVEKYRRTSSAPIGGLALARLDFHNGRYEEAEKRYAQFLKDYPQHPLAPVAEVNRATCLEAIGRLEEALKIYEAVRSRESTSLQGSLALLGRARTFEQMGRYTEARQAYEEYLALHPEGPFAGVAEAGLKVLEQKRRAAQKLVETGLPPPLATSTNPPAPAAVVPTGAAPADANTPRR